VMKERRYFFIEIKRYYPEIFDKIVANYMNEYFSHISKSINKGIEQGMFRKTINVDIITAFLFDLMTSSKQNKELFRKYSMENLFENTVLCYIRGISTEKGQQLIDDIIKRDYSCFGNAKISRNEIKE